MVKPRYIPTWGDQEESYEVLLGHVGPLDVYYEDNLDKSGEKWCIVVGPNDRKINGEGSHNFDVYVIADRNRLEPHVGMCPRLDLHIELPEMCEIMKLLVDGGYMDG